MSTQLPINNPTGYMGLKETNPPQLYFFKRDPTTADYRAYDPGDIWVNPINNTVWQMVKKISAIATWVNLGGGATQLTTITADLGGVVTPVANNVFAFGGLGIHTTAAGDTLTIVNDGVTYVQPDVGVHITPAGGSGEINIIGSGAITTVTTAPDTIQIQLAAAPMFTWNEVAINTAMAQNNGYYVNNAAPLTLTLPAVAVANSTIRVAGKGAGGWVIAQNAGQVISFNALQSTTIGVGGSVSSTDQYDSLELLCVTANTEWVCVNQRGNPVLA